MSSIEERLTLMEKEIINLKEKINELDEDLEECKRIKLILEDEEDRKVFELARMMNTDCKYINYTGRHDWMEKSQFNELNGVIYRSINNLRNYTDLFCCGEDKLCKKCRKHINNYINDNKKPDTY